jgi:hypothetical protein
MKSWEEIVKETFEKIRKDPERFMIHPEYILNVQPMIKMYLVFP